MNQMTILTELVRTQQSDTEHLKQRRKAKASGPGLLAQLPNAVSDAEIKKEDKVERAPKKKKQKSSAKRFYEFSSSAKSDEKASNTPSKKQLIGKREDLRISVRFLRLQLNVSESKRSFSASVMNRVK